jgi:hypothetical protein
MMRTSIPAEELVTKARAIGQYYGCLLYTSDAADDM